MPEQDRPRRNGTPSKRRGQDREVLEKMWAARSRNARERRIRELIEQAPALTAEQCARLSTLLNSGTAATAASGGDAA